MFLTRPTGKSSFWENSNYRWTVNNSSHQKLLGTRANEFGLTQMPSCNTDFDCTLRMQLSKQNKVVSYNYYKKRLYGKRRKDEGNSAKRNIDPTDAVAMLSYPLTGSMTVAPVYSSPASALWAGSNKSCFLDYKTYT